MFKIPKNNWNFINDNKILELNNIFNSISDFFPREDKVLRFLESDFTNLKYIIVGMEPYPSSYEENGIIIPEATGRSFEVSNMINKTWASKFKQSSLRNILKTIYYNETNTIKSLDEIRIELENNSFSIKNPTDWFNSMEEQGILFLNASLTVEPYNVGSHTKLWNSFIKDLITHINNNSNANWLLWGNDAKNRVYELVDKDKCILSCHPRLAQFVNENCFQYTKDINWKG